MPSVSTLTTADPALLVQLSDSHLFAEADGTLLGMNTRESLQKVIEQVLKQQPRIDLMLATGICHRTEHLSRINCFAR